MLPILFQSLILASVGVLSIGSITIIILLLMSDNGFRNGLGYMLGYVGGYMIIGLSVILLGYTAATNDSSNESNSFLTIFLVILGLLLLVVAWRNWRKAPEEYQENARFISIINKITPPKAFALGAIITFINFKNLALFLTAISIPLLSNLTLPAKIIIILLDAIVFCLAVIVPVLVYILVPKRARQFLQWTKQSLDANSRAIGIWLPLIFGFILIIRGVTEIL